MVGSRNRASASYEGTNFSTYRYEPLLEDSQAIRLLTLLPGDFNTKLRATLHAEPLIEDNIPVFEALSYAWGSNNLTRRIFLGPDEQYTLAVTRNLANALRHLRSKIEPRVLWIDAICVDQ
jgi:hypothetical protein